MKNFFQFLTEATVATQQATRMGLKGDGHGGWYSNQGEFVAKTEKGRLKFYNKREIIGAKDPDQSEYEKNYSIPSIQDPAATQQQAPVDSSQAQVPQQDLAQQPVEVPLQIGPAPIPKTKGTLTVVFGRFNPPMIAHQQLMDTAAMAAEADQSDYLIYPSRSQDEKKNPLDPDTKISYMRRMFPAHSERIVNDNSTQSIFDVLKRAHNDGYANVRIVSGPSRVKEFEKLSNNYNGQLYQFDAIEVIPGADYDPDSDGMEGLSSSRMRLAAAEGDFRKFREGLPPDMPRRDAIDFFDAVRSSMNIQEKWETWQIAPKLDLQTLRENYVSEKIFKIGDYVENLNTGLSGKIIRRGTNYLICVTEDNIMFKSWIKDVNESYTEKEMKRTMRDSIHKNTLIGTDGYLKNTMNTMGISYIKNFINKNRKK